ncbi:unnamed protein product, partial [Aphanomyces euteiches]
AANNKETEEFQTAKLLSLMPKELRAVTHVIMERDEAERTVVNASIKLLAEYEDLQAEGLFKISMKYTDDAVLNVNERGQQRNLGYKKFSKKDKCNNCGK